MKNTAEQFAATNKANLQALQGFTAQAFSGLEKLVELNLAASKAVMEESFGHAQAVLSAKDAKELLALQSGLVQPGCHLFHQLGQVCPGVGLPDAIFFFAHGRRAAALGGVLEQKSWERGQHGWYLVSRVKLPGNKKSGFAVVP